MADYDLGTASGKVELDFDDKATAKAAAALGKVGVQLQSAVTSMAKSITQYSNNFVSGFRDSRAALSAFSGTMGTLGGITRTAVQPLINGFGNFVSGFRSSQAAASAFTGVLGTIGGVVRTAVQPAINSVGNFVSGFNSSQAAASAFTGVLGTLGGVARTMTQPIITGTQNFVSGFQSSAAAASAFSGTMGTVGGAVRSAMSSAVGSVQNFTSNVGPAFNNFRSAASSAASHVSSAISGAFTTASVAAIAATANLVKSVLEVGVGYNSLEQRARMAFKTILGSGEKSVAMMNELAEFSRQSPFRREIFIEGAQRLMAFGVETKKVIPTLGALQDAIAAAGGTEADLRGIVLTMAKISSTGKVTGGDLIEFGNRGVNAAELIGKAMGMTAAEFRAHMRENVVDSEFALDALVNGMNEKFGGAAANLKTTWPGAIDRVKGSWRDFSSAIVDPFVSKGGGGFGVAWANTLADALRAAIPAVQQFFEMVGNKIRPAMEGAAAATSAFIKSGNFAAIGDSISKIAPLFGPLIGAVIAFGSSALNALPLIGRLFPVISGPVGIILGLLTSLVAISPELRSALGGAFQTIASALSTAAPMITTVMDTLIGLLPPIASLLAQLLAALMPIVPVVMELVTAIGDALGQVLVAIAPLIENLAEILGAALGAALPIVIALVKLLVAAIKLLLPIIVAVIGWIAQLLTAITDVDNIMAVWNAVVGFFVGVWNAIVNAFTTAWNGIVVFFTTIWTTISTAVMTAMNALVGALVAAWTSVMSFFSTLFAPLQPVFDSFMGMMQAFWDFVIALWNFGVGWLQIILGVLGAAISAAWANISKAVMAVVNAIWAFIVARWNAIVAAVTAAMNAVRAVVTAVWNAILGFIRPIVTSIWNTIVTAFNAVKASVTAILTGLFSAVKSTFDNIVRTITSIKNTIIGAFAGAAGWLWNAGVNIIQGLINGIKSMFDNVKGALQGLTANLTSWKGPESVDKVILVASGELIIDGLITGFKNKLGEVKSTLQGLTKSIPAVMQSTLDISTRVTVPNTLLDTSATLAVRPAMASVASQAASTGRSDGGTTNVFQGDILVPLESLEELGAFTAFINEFRRIQRQEGGD